jgi:hypothetical protein
MTVRTASVRATVPDESAFSERAFRTMHCFQHGSPPRLR